MTRLLRIISVLLLSLASPAMAQPLGPPTPTRADFMQRAPSSLDRPNPVRVLSDAAAMVPGQAGRSDEGGLSVALNIMILLTVITLVPSIMLMTTCFMRIMIVLALVRQAIGAQSIPPPQVITGLALFLTAMVMAPTIDRVWNEAVVPYQAGEITDYDELWDRAKRPMRDYMFDQIEATGNWSSVYMILEYRGVDISDPSRLTRADVDMMTLVPGYMLSELKVGFVMGFKVYLPFLVIDMVIATILISMSMMMLPPVLISLPFKLLLFVLVDGWTLVVGSLLQSFVQDGDGARLSAQAASLPLVMLLCLPIKRGDARHGIRRNDDLHRPRHPLYRAEDLGPDPARGHDHRPAHQPLPVGDEHPGPDAHLRAQDRRDGARRRGAAPLEHAPTLRVHRRDADALLSPQPTPGAPDDDA